jgi:hypothetical protein
MKAIRSSHEQRIAELIVGWLNGAGFEEMYDCDLMIESLNLFKMRRFST